MHPHIISATSILSLERVWWIFQVTLLLGSRHHKHLIVNWYSDQHVLLRFLGWKGLVKCPFHWKSLHVAPYIWYLYPLTTILCVRRTGCFYLQSFRKTKRLKKMQGGCGLWAHTFTPNCFKMVFPLHVTLSCLYCHQHMSTRADGWMQTRNLFNWSLIATEAHLPFCKNTCYHFEKYLNK